MKGNRAVLTGATYIPVSRTTATEADPFAATKSSGIIKPSQDSYPQDADCSPTTSGAHMHMLKGEAVLQQQQATPASLMLSRITPYWHNDCPREPTLTLAHSESKRS